MQNNPAVRRSAGRRHVAAAATHFEEVLEHAAKLVAIELRIKRPAEEIRTTSVRVNAPDTMQPRLDAQRAAITRVLDEREREDVFRLKRAKAKLRTQA